MGRKVKIVCNVCNGSGKVEEEEFETRKKIWCVCPACGGTGWILSELAEGGGS